LELRVKGPVSQKVCVVPFASSSILYLYSILLRHVNAAQTAPWACVGTRCTYQLQNLLQSKSDPSAKYLAIQGALTSCEISCDPRVNPLESRACCSSPTVMCPDLSTARKFTCAEPKNERCRRRTDACTVRVVSACASAC